MNKQAQKDFGFGDKAGLKGQPRLINRDGSFNSKRIGVPFYKANSFFHWAINCSWSKFLLAFFIAFVLVNFLFALSYYYLGPQSIDGFRSNEPIERFFDSFFFSVHTFSTVGFGHLSPKSFGSNIIVCLQVLAGLLSVALASGCFFARFSRPTAKIISSDFAVVSPYRDSKGLMFRIANERNNQVIDLNARVIFSALEDSTKMASRKFYELSLERDYVTFFSLFWTLVHPIDESSPLYQLSKEDIINRDAELLVFLSGVDDTFSQNVYSWLSYKADEIVWNASFTSMIEEKNTGELVANLSKINEIN